MNISGVLVKAYPKNIKSVWSVLAKLDGVEVHGSNDDGRMVVTVEQDDTKELSQLIASMNDISGVLSTSMIYHQFED